MSQKYQMDSGNPPCKTPIQCQRIPYKDYQKPRYALPYTDKVPFIKEDYVHAANVTLDNNSCKYNICPPNKPLTSSNQKPPFYKLGPHPNISDPPTYVYTMPNQSIVYGQPTCNIDLRRMPWYGTYDNQ